MAKEMSNLVTIDDLNKELVFIPGGDRILMCLGYVFHDAGADGIVIIAMADDINTLLWRVQSEGLTVTRSVGNYGGVEFTNVKYTTRASDPLDGMIVLDIPPSEIRCLDLQNIAQLRETVDALRKAADKAPLPSPKPGA